MNYYKEFFRILMKNKELVTDIDETGDEIVEI